MPSLQLKQLSLLAMTAAFGVYLGCTTASLAVCRDSNTDVVANDAGNRVTPAVVAFTDHDQAVGLAAKQGRLRNASNTVQYVKQAVGRDWEDELMQELVKKTTAKMVKKDDKAVYEVEYNEKRTTFSPAQIAALIYKRLMATATSHGEEGESHDTVLSVSIYYSESQKKALKSSADSAGFNVIRVISEPVAAMLAYDIGQNDNRENCTVLVYKLGGTCLDLSIYLVNSGMYRLVTHTRHPSLGGDRIEEFLMDKFIDDFQKQWSADCKSNVRVRLKVRNASEEIKHILSTMTNAQSYVESLYDGIDFQCKLSRMKFEALTSDFFTECMEPLTDLLDQAQMGIQDIDKVILCGGTTKTPILQKKIKDYFSQSEILSSIPPDEVLAVGAAKQAAILSGSEPEEILFSETQNTLPCLTHSIFVQTEDSLVNVLPQFTPVPTRRQHKFLLNPEQTSFTMKVSVQAATNQESVPLAQISMDDLPAGCQILGVFHLRSDGSLHITCSEPTSNSSKDVTIEAAS